MEHTSDVRSDFGPDSNSDLIIEVLKLKKAALVLRALNHPLRQQLLRLLHQHGELTVTEIQSKICREQSLVSQQLSILRRENLVVAERVNRNVYYSLNHRRLHDVNHCNHHLVRHNAPGRF